MKDDFYKDYNQFWKQVAIGLLVGTIIWAIIYQFLK